MKKTAIFAVLLLCITAVLTAGCVGTDEPVEPIDYATALIGDWKSEGTYTSGDKTFSMIYHFREDNTGTIVADANGQVLTTIDVFWGHVENNGYIVAYTTSSTADYLYISEDGKILINEFGETFKKI